MSQSAEILKEQFSKSLGLPWQDILPASRLNQILEEERIAYRSRLYTPVVTLWAMIHQVLSADKSLRNTLKCMSTWLIAAGEAPPSSDTGAYRTPLNPFNKNFLFSFVISLITHHIFFYFFFFFSLNIILFFLYYLYFIFY